MQIIFNQSPSQDLYVYIHCTTAGEQFSLSQKMHTHSEYDTKWSNLLEEWRKKEYYKYCIEKELSSRNDVVTILQFTNCRSEDFIQELCTYLQSEHFGGYMNAEYKSFN
jgi:hypothetical protein